MRIHQLGTDTNDCLLTDTTRITAHVLVKWPLARNVHVTTNLKRAYVQRNGQHAVVPAYFSVRTLEFVRNYEGKPAFEPK
jgi:hypothetical protein